MMTGLFKFSNQLPGVRKDSGLWQYKDMVNDTTVEAAQDAAQPWKSIPLAWPKAGERRLPVFKDRVMVAKYGDVGEGTVIGVDLDSSSANIAFDDGDEGWEDFDDVEIL